MSRPRNCTPRRPAPRQPLVIPLRAMRLLAVGLLAVGWLGSLACGPSSRSPRSALTVFAAASLRDVGSELADTFLATHGSEERVEITFNFAGSNTLAQQIAAAPGADIFLSADGHWVDFLIEAGRIVPGSRRPIYSNQLVLIVHEKADLPLRRPEDLARLPFRFLALADPEGVPAGRYARAALEAIPWQGGTLWENVSPRVAPTLDVRGALGLVESDPEIAGIVYATDAATSEKVRIAYTFPASTSPSSGAEPITYWAVAVEGSPNPEEARRFLAFLASPEALEIGARHGFLPPPEGAPDGSHPGESG